MTFKVQVGPSQIAIHQGQTVLITDPDGTITWPSEKGLYFLDTRVVSHWSIYANGVPWQLLNGGPISYYAARIYLTLNPFSPKMVRSRREHLALQSAVSSAVACMKTSTSPTTA
ncbi:MAG TPA: glycogen debranching N-terminal domain-containing protein [Xanthobacteraceae bacterium]|nr:glycogen debranching N-terminal domain-containing protein [Xanthobacteraceae bacterium]